MTGRLEIFILPGATALEWPLRAILSLARIRRSPTIYGRPPVTGVAPRLKSGGMLPQIAWKIHSYEELKAGRMTCGPVAVPAYATIA